MSLELSLVTLELKELLQKMIQMFPLRAQRPQMEEAFLTLRMAQRIVLVLMPLLMLPTHWRV